MSLIDIVLTEEQQEGTTSTLQRWLKQPGETVRAHEPVAELETDKVVMELAAPTSGTVAELLKEEGDEIEPGEVIARIQPGEVAAVEADLATQVPSTAVPSIAPATASREKRLSPAVRKLVEQYNLDPEAMAGSGRDGRLTVDDVERFLEQALTTEETEAVDDAEVPSTEGIPSHKVPHDNMRKRIASHMVSSLLQTAPHVTSVFEADLSAIVQHRSKNKAAFAEKDVKLTLTAYFVKACAEAMEEVPEVNSRWHEEELEIFEDINVGVGTALEDKGLIVPVIMQAQTLDLFDIASRLQELIEKARNGELTPADVQGGTFTISNHGVSGSLVATPIVINQPQSAILGVGKMEPRAVVRDADGQHSIQIRPMCYVTLTIDHRVLDAFQTNKYLTKLISIIQSWTD